MDVRPEPTMHDRKIASLLLFSTLLASAAYAQDAARQQRSEQLFGDMYRVLSHPRRVNCHPKGDSPKQGLDARVHSPPVARGAHDTGVAGLQCAACHRTANYRASGVPGAPNWHLAPASMAWEGLSAGELCRSMLDKSRNGSKTVAQIVHHLTRDELVAWGWAPGVDADGRRASRCRSRAPSSTASSPPGPRPAHAVRNEGSHRDDIAHRQRQDDDVDPPTRRCCGSCATTSA